MEYQLRRYQIAPGKLDEFVEGWTSGVVPLREQFGFRVRGAWSIPESSEFVWIISYDGPDGLAAADARYYDSNERRSLSPNPAVHIIGSDHKMAMPVLEPDTRK